MTVLEKMLKVRSELINSDRDKAIKALMSKLYYEVASVVTSGDCYTLFNYEYDLRSFCEAQNIDIRAMNWLIESMCDEGLLTKGKSQVVLTPLGVQKLCLS